jgi:hypothetical protein
MKTPYTTRSGVRIGSDDLRIQRALLGERQRVDWDGIAIVITTAAAVAALIFWSYK